MFNFPHGLGVDREGNVWVTDERGENGKGDVVVKFSQDGKVLMTLGKPGMPGDSHGHARSSRPTSRSRRMATSSSPTATAARPTTASSSSPRTASSSRPGASTARAGRAQHAALDRDRFAGRVFVADRVNSRIQIFDQDGKFLAEWKQFGRPSSVFIDKNDVALRRPTANRTTAQQPGFKQGIRIGSAKDGKVTAFIPDPGAEISTPEAVAANDPGVIYGGYTGKMALRRWVKN